MKIGPFRLRGVAIVEHERVACTFNTWLATNFRCGNTRTQLANWGTRISQVVP